MIVSALKHSLRLLNAMRTLRVTLAHLRQVFLGFALLGVSACTLIPDQASDGDNGAVGNNGPQFAADCGVRSDRILYQGKCVPMSPTMRVADPISTDIVRRTTPQGSLHPSLLAAGHPADHPLPGWRTGPQTNPPNVIDYILWAKNVVMLPVLRLEQIRIEEEIRNWKSANDHDAWIAALQYAALGRNQALIDTQLGTLYETAGENATRLNDCLSVMKAHQYAALGTIEYEYERADQAKVQACLDTYLATLAALDETNERYGERHGDGSRLVDPKHIEEHVNVVLLAKEILPQGLNAHTNVEDIQALLLIRELPAAVIVLWEAVTEPLILAQSLYPLVRANVPSLQAALGFLPPVILPDGSEARYSITGTLGSITELAIEAKHNPVTLAQRYYPDIDEVLRAKTDAEREAWEQQVASTMLGVFRQALMQVLQTTRDNNLKVQQSLDSFPVSEAWLLALAAEAMNAMSLYGGQDIAGAKLGYQAMHDQLMAEAQAKKGSGLVSGLSVGASFLCLGVSFVAGLVGTPVMSLVTLGICAMATGISAVQVALLSQYAQATNQLAFMGFRHALFPPKEASEMQAQTNLAAELAVLDILLMGWDVIGAARALPGSQTDSLVKPSPSMVNTRSKELRPALASADSASRTHIRGLLNTFGVPQITNISDSARNLIDNVTTWGEIDTGVVLREGLPTMKLGPVSDVGITRTTTLEHLAQTPVGSKIMNAIDNWGMPHWGFVDNEFVDAGLAGGYRHGGWKTERWDIMTDAERAYATPHNGSIAIKSNPAAWDTLLEKQGAQINTLGHELTHYLDLLTGAGHSDLAIAGKRMVQQEKTWIPIGKRVFIGPEAEQTLRELATARNVPFWELYQDFRAFLSEIRAYRVSYTLYEELGFSWAQGRKIDFASHTLDRWVLFVKEEFGDGGSFYFDHTNIFWDVASNDPATLRRLIPDELWRDPTKPEFWFLDGVHAN